MADGDGPSADHEHEDLVHVVFDLDVVDGWPPVSGERVWARPLGDDAYELVNVPWFVRGIAEGDVVRAIAPAEDQWPVYAETSRWSGNLTIRVIPFAAGPLGGDQDEVLAKFNSLGVFGESAGTYPIVALTVTPTVSRPEVKQLLARGVAEGWWEYEEGCVDDAWTSL